MPFNMLDDRYIELIDDYLDGILSQEKTEKLQAELKENQELRELLDLIQVTRESIRLSGQKELVQKIHGEFINDSHKERNKGKVVNLKLSPWWLGIAASLTLLILFGNFWYKTQTTALFEDNYIAYNLPTMRSAGDMENKVTTLYKNGDYNEIIGIVDLNSEDTELLFLSGMSHFQMENYEESAQFLKKVQQLNENRTFETAFFQDEADYYLFLAYLKTGNLSEADQYLSRITSQSNHTYHGMIGKVDNLKFEILKFKNKN